MTQGRTYKETLDQAPMTDRIDLAMAAGRSRSFLRLDHAVDELLTAIDRGQNTVTPPPAPDQPNEAAGGPSGSRNL